jgi:acyl-CoA synthetase (AMP-forming)/AMP-acid ligase II
MNLPAMALAPTLAELLAGHVPTAGIATPRDVHRLEAGMADPLEHISSTYELLARGAARAPDAPAASFFVELDQYAQASTWTHREWMHRITATANLMRGLGIGRDDVVAFVLPNLPETHWVLWGGEAAGVAFALNPLLEAPMLRDLMAAVRPKVLVTLAPSPGADLWEKVAGIAPEIPGLEIILTVWPFRYGRAVVGRQPVPQLPGLRVLDFHGQLRGMPGERLAFPPPRLDDAASCFCTGGTTGLPKIAVRTHRTEAANAVQLAAMFGGTLPGPIFCGMPLFHVNAQIGTGLMPWALGGHVVLGTPAGYRTPGLLARFWSIVEHFRLFSFSGVPTVYSALMQVPREGRDLSSLSFGLCGAAPMPLELFRRFEAETGVKILEGYGLTEAGCVSTLNPPAGPSRAGAIGIRLPWQEVKVVLVDEGGRYVREAAVDEVGTVVIAGPNLFRGYLHREHDAEAWIPLPTEAGSAPCLWLNTGDLGRRDADGYFWLVGRTKELIIRGGHNIDPKLIEEPMHQHPAVALAAAVGRPDAHAGEVPVLYVQLRPAASASPEELLAWAEGRIAERAAWPKRVEILPALPTTAVGKLFKPALVEREVTAVVDEEARAAGATLRSCQVVPDPRRGLVVRWAADGAAALLGERLARYTFHQEPC